MNIEKNIWEQFLEFETKNELFKLQDSSGTFYWDIIRFDIYVSILWQNNVVPAQKNKFCLKKILLTATSFVYQSVKLKFSFSKHDNLFYLASRNKINNIFIDQNARAVYDFFSEKEKFVIESFMADNNLKNSFFLPQRLYRKIYRKKNEGFSHLMNLLEEEFGNLPFDESYLQNLLNNYYSDYSFFSKLLQRKKVKRIFLTQNGIQKGLIKVAKDLNIPIFEFQHGIVDVGHLAYCYPKLDYDSYQILLPNVILSLSPFWFQGLNLPNVKICSIGNDYFCLPLNEIKKQTNEEGNGITVVSSDVFGEYLANFLINAETQNIVGDIPIYFKLHPNQFHEKQYYTEKLKSIKTLQVITNEFSVSKLLAKSSSLLAVQSTAVYEALQVQKKVFILKRSSYKRQEHIFNHPNLYLIDNVEEFSRAFSKEIDTNYETDFFVPFSKEEFLKLV